MSIVETEVDGIRTLFAERADGHVSGGLVFRVGWADENLAVRGLTHLVAHLALCQVAPDVHVHLNTHATHTHVRAQGTPESVAQLLGAVCSALADLPTDRIEDEKEALLAEAAERIAPVRPDALYRYGARGHGLVAYPETGLPAIGPDLVQIWAAEAFTRGNAVLWLSGDRMPDGLRLPLVDGPQQPLADPLAPLTDTPAWYRSPVPDRFGVSGVVPRSPASAVFAEVLGRSLQAELVGPDGLASSAGAAYGVRDATSAVVSVSADARPDEQDGVAGGFVDVLSRIRWGRLSAEAVASVTRELAADAARRPADHETVAARAVSRVLGIPWAEPDELAAAYTAVGPEQVRACAEAFHATALAAVHDRGLDWAGWTAAPVESPDEVSGSTHPGVEGHDGRLVVGEEGVTAHLGGIRSTVRFDDLALVTSYADGGRHLVGTDGFQVEVEPTLYRLAPGTLERLDEAVDLARVVRVGPRHPDDLPRPAPRAVTVAPEAPPVAPAPPPAPDRPGWRDRLSRRGRHST